MALGQRQALVLHKRLVKKSVEFAMKSIVGNRLNFA